MDQGRVLVVEDDPGIRSLLAEVFTSRGACVEVVADGGEAIEALGRLPGDFGLIVTDLWMPGLDGMALLDYVRAAGVGVPVIVLSGIAEEEGVEREALARGAAAVIRKPFVVTALLAQADVARAHAGAYGKSAPAECLRTGSEASC